MHVFNMVILRCRRDLAQARHLAGNAVDVGHLEIDVAFLRRRQQMQDRIGRAAHRDVQRHRVFKCFARGDIARQGRRIILLVITFGEVNDQATGAQEQGLAVCMRGEDRAIAGQGQAQRFSEAIHGIRREHARARSASRASRAFDRSDLLVRDRRVACLDHGIDQIELLDFFLQAGNIDGRRFRLRMQRFDDLARFHRTARDEHDRDIQPHRRHQHARRDLVAIRDAHHRIGAMRIDHVFNGIGDQFARRQRVQHAAMAHGNAVIDGDRVEFLGHAAGRFDFTRDELTEVFQVDMAGNELRE